VHVFVEYTVMQENFCATDGFVFYYTLCYKLYSSDIQSVYYVRKKFEKYYKVSLCENRSLYLVVLIYNCVLCVCSQSA